jgi:hypothetical protein
MISMGQRCVMMSASVKMVLIKYHMIFFILTGLDTEYYMGASLIHVHVSANSQQH